MEQQPDLLDDFSNTLEYASTGQRFINYIIDVIAFYVLIFIFGILLGATGLLQSAVLLYLIIFAIMLGYYTVMEGITGKTFGKMLTKTKAVTLHGEPLNLKNAFLRSLCRLVPFEAFSAFGGGQMWHDKWTDTMVVQNKN